MEIILYIYFGINLMLLGSYLFDTFNNDSKITKIFSSVVLFFFGGILVVYELTIADTVAEWWSNSELNWLWNIYILKKFDNLESNKIKYLKKSILAQKDKNSKLVRQLTKIVKRNGYVK